MSTPRRRRRRSSITLPEDIIGHEILVRLLVRSLLRFRCVCKSWHALISNPRFIDAHLQRARKTPRLLIMPLASYRPREFSLYTYDQEGTSRMPRLLFSEKLPQRLDTSWPPAHSIGLLLLNTIYGKLIVCNPSTRECLFLPDGTRNAPQFPMLQCQRGNSRAGFGFVPSINAYKVARHFYRSYSYSDNFFQGPIRRSWSMGFEVFILGVDSCWRSTKEIPPYPFDGTAPMSVGQSIYFRIDKLLHTSPTEAFVNFNLSDENFRVISLPPALSGASSYRHMSFVDLEGDTCFVNLSEGGKKFDMWLVKDCTTKYKWMHMLSIDLVQPDADMPMVRINTLRPIDMIFPLTMRHEKLLVCFKGELKKLEYCDPQSISLETVVDLANDLYYFDPQKHKSNIFSSNSRSIVIPHIESLVPINVGR